MVYSKDDEDEAYRRFAEACGRAWAPKGSLIATALGEGPKAKETEPKPSDAPIKSAPSRKRRLAKTGL